MRMTSNSHAATGGKGLTQDGASVYISSCERDARQGIFILKTQDDKPPFLIPLPRPLTAKEGGGFLLGEFEGN